MTYFQSRYGNFLVLDQPNQLGRAQGSKHFGGNFTGKYPFTQAHKEEKSALKGHEVSA